MRVVGAKAIVSGPEGSDGGDPALHLGDHLPENEAPLGVASRQASSQASNLRFARHIGPVMMAVRRQMDAAGHGAEREKWAERSRMVMAVKWSTI